MARRRRKRAKMNPVALIFLWPFYLLILPLKIVVIIGKLIMGDLISSSTKDYYRKRNRDRYHRNKRP